MTRRYFGSVRRLPSGKFQARYTGPDGETYKAPRTFDREKATKKEREQGVLGADDWLAATRAEILAGRWSPPEDGDPEDAGGVPTLEAYAARWLDGKTKLTPRSRALYRHILDKAVLPWLGRRKVDTLDEDLVNRWYDLLDPGKPTARARAYGLLSNVMAAAVADKRLPTVTINPCTKKGATTVRRRREIEVVPPAEVGVIAEHMPESLRLAVLLSYWAALRYGEVAELRRKDIVVKDGRGVIRVRRAVTWPPGMGAVVGEPKSDAGRRTVALPPHLLPVIADHLDRFAQPGPDGLLFPGPNGEQIRGSSSGRHFKKARTAAGLPALRWHDLRHSGLTMAARTGATVAELMSRAGHSSPEMSLRYQHSAAERDVEIAAALSAMVE